MRKIFPLMALFCIVHPALAEDECKSHKDLIDKRLGKPGYTA